jgi:hypothetical protein
MRSKTHANPAAGRNIPPQTPHNRALRIIAHVGVAGRQPHLYAARDRNHRDLAFASTATITLTVEASTVSVR